MFAGDGRLQYGTVVAQRQPSLNRSRARLEQFPNTNRGLISCPGTGRTLKREGGPEAGNRRGEEEGYLPRSLVSECGGGWIDGRVFR